MAHRVIRSPFTRRRLAVPAAAAVLALATVACAPTSTEEGGAESGAEAVVSEETLEELRAALTVTGTRMLLELLASELPEPRPQEGEPTYAAKIEPEEHHLDWTRPAVELHRVIRLGRAWTTFRDRRMRVLRAGLFPGADLGPGEIDITSLVVGAGEGALELVEVQPEGKGPQPAAAWRNGARVRAGERFV